MTETSPQGKKFKKNQILFNRDIFNQALNSLITINQKSVETRIEKEINSVDLQSLLTANDKDFAPLMTLYCNKTGQELSSFDYENLKLLIAVHGRDRALELLKHNACSQYSPLWLHSDPKTLNKLMYFDPQGFFVYAASHIFHCDLIVKSNLPKKSPHSQAGNKETTEDTEITNFLKEFPDQTKPQDLTEVSILAETDIRYFNLQDKIISNRNLQLYHDILDITETNELLRKFLGLADPKNVASLVQFSFEFLHQVTESPDNLKLFNEELKQAIKTLFEKHFKSIKRKKQEGHPIKVTKGKKLSSASVAEVKAKFGGLTHFHQQPAIRNSNIKESILFDLENFWDESAERDDTLKNFRAVGNSADFSPNKAGLDPVTGEPLNRHKAKKGFRLNINKK